jgi:hypothetical protein
MTARGPNANPAMSAFPPLFAVERTTNPTIGRADLARGEFGRQSRGAL